MKRVAFSLMILVALSSVSVIYARLTRPLLQVASLPPGVGRQLEPPAPSPEFATVAQQYLPRDPWAIDAPYRHRDDNTFVYCDRYQLGNRQQSLSVRPFAVVMMESVRTGRETKPITLVADSAQMDFSSALNDDEFNVGRVTSGQLLGTVRIEGPDGLLIVGRNFFVSESSKRIWSDDIVLFRYGPHFGRGRGVEIRLATSEDSKGILAAEAIRTVRLREDVALELLRDGEVRTKSTPQTELIHVNSRGHLEFDLETNIATLERDVRVRQPTGPESEDTLKCDVLSIQFREEPKDSEDTENTDGGLKPVQLMAQGNIELQSPENELLVTQVTDLTYLLDERVIELANTLAFADGSGPPIRIVQESSDITCRRVILVHDEDHNVTTVVCRSPGQLRTRDPKQNNQLALFAKWDSELRMEPDPTSDLSVLKLVGNALVRQPLEQTQLSAETIRLWFDRPPSEPESETQTSPSAVTAEANVHPVRLIAETNVSIRSPRMSGPTNRLVVDFETRPPTDLTSRERGEFRQTAFQRQKRTAPAGGQLFDKAFGVSAGSIQARIRPEAGDGESEMPEVRLEGRVLVQSLDSKENPAVVIRGEVLHVLEDDAGNQTVKLLGQPGSVLQNDRLITGSSIFLDRAGNEAEVIGKGGMRFVVDKDLEGQPLETPEPLHIVWTSGMHFDGTVADLQGDVTATLGDDETQRQELICPQMKVHFSEPVSFSDGFQDGNEAELGKLLEYIECLGGVTVNSFEFSQGRTIEERHGFFRDMTMNQQTGEMTAAGPGWLTSWTQDRPRLSRAVSARANESITARKAGWNFTRIDYMGTLKGNFRTQVTTFRQNVEIVYGPVERLSQAIDPDAGVDGELPDGAIRIRCDQLEVTGRGDDPDQRTVELHGTGNAILEGRTIHAEADAIKYDERKELFTLLGKGNRMARIWQREHPRARWGNELSAQRWEYSERRQKLTAHGVTDVRGGR